MDGTIGPIDGYITVVKSSTSSSGTCDLLYELRHLVLRISLIEIICHNIKRIWVRIFCLPDDVRQLVSSGTCVRLRGYIITLENSLIVGVSMSAGQVIFNKILTSVAQR